jgi:hypothetical protein
MQQKSRKCENKLVYLETERCKMNLYLKIGVLSYM